MYEWQVKLYDPLLTCGIPKCLYMRHSW